MTNMCFDRYKDTPSLDLEPTSALVITTEDSDVTVKIVDPSTSSVDFDNDALTEARQIMEKAPPQVHVAVELTPCCEDTARGCRLLKSVLDIYMTKAALLEELRIAVPQEATQRTAADNALGLLPPDFEFLAPLSPFNALGLTLIEQLPAPINPPLIKDLLSVDPWWCGDGLIMSRLKCITLDYSMAYDECLDLLLRCPTLEELTVGWLLQSAQPVSVRRTSKQVVLDHLTKLTARSIVDLKPFFAVLNMLQLRCISLTLPYASTPDSYDLSWSDLDEVVINCDLSSESARNLRSLCSQAVDCRQFVIHNLTT